MADCLIALGSNVGDRAATLDEAAAALNRLPETRLVGVSRWIATPPVGGPGGQQAFLNGAARLETGLDPRQLIDGMLAIESGQGRERRVRWAARTLDLDLLLYGEESINGPGVEVPHPRMTFRPFVMDPAVQVAGGMRHPRLAATLEVLHETLSGGRDQILIAGAEKHRTRVVDLLLNASPSCRLADDASVVVVDSGAGSPRVDRPKLQILTDATAEPEEAIPTLWLDSESGDRLRAEVQAALECVWPNLD